MSYNDTDSVVALCVSAERPHVATTRHRIECGKGRAMKSSVIKRSIVLARHKTSVSLEEAFWRGVKDIAASRRMTLSDPVGSIDSGRKHGNLSSAIRLFVLNHYQARSSVVEQPPLRRAEIERAPNGVGHSSA